MELILKLFTFIACLTVMVTINFAFLIFIEYIAIFIEDKTGKKIHVLLIALIMIASCIITSYKILHGLGF